MESPGIWILLGIAALGIAFLTLREMVCWYWKINELCDLLHRQTGYLVSIDRGITAMLRRLGAAPDGSPDPALDRASPRP